MEDRQSERRRPDQIDFPVLWFIVRGVQMLLIVFYAKVTYLARGTEDFTLDLVSVGIMLMMICVFFRGIATGNTDSSGIHYRIYFRQKTVAWTDVQGIQWVNFRLKVLVKRQGKRKRTIIFLLNPLKTTGAYWAHRLGAEVSPPDILERIHALPIETPPPIASAPLYPKWIVRTFIGLVVLMMVVMVWRLVSALALNPH
jgi:hypothetical protein